MGVGAGVEDLLTGSGLKVGPTVVVTGLYTGWGFSGFSGLFGLFGVSWGTRLFDENPPNNGGLVDWASFCLCLLGLIVGWDCTNWTPMNKILWVKEKSYKIFYSKNRSLENNTISTVKLNFKFNFKHSKLDNN